MLLLTCLRGSIILYQGEELGLPQVDVPFEHLQDPEAIANWPETLGRDGARTPMAWSSTAPNLGFSSGDPWLPTGDGHRDLAVDRQEADPASLLAFTRKCLRLRKAHPTLRLGSMRSVEVGEQMLVYERSDGRARLRCTFNLSDRPASFTPSGKQLIGTGSIDDASLGPYAGVVEELE
jgi:alpha-glucosidase